MYTMTVAEGRTGVELSFSLHGRPVLDSALQADVVAVIATKRALTSVPVDSFVRAFADAFPNSDLYATWTVALEKYSSPDRGSSIVLTFLVDGKLRKLFIGIVPDPSKVCKSTL